MKDQNFTLISLIFALIISFSACSSTQKASEKQINMVTENHESEDYLFPEGIYYSYQFEAGRPAYDFDVEALVEKLAKSGIPVKNLWYKGASSSCTPPGSSMSMSVVVDAVLIIQTAEVNEKVGEMGFRRTTAASMGNCAYRVSRYIF